MWLPSLLWVCTTGARWVHVKPAGKQRDTVSHCTGRLLHNEHTWLTHSNTVSLFMHVCAPLSCRFPPEEEQLQLWISSMRTAAGWRPSESARLCSDHFTSDCFQTSGHLYSFAVPSVFQSTVGLHCIHYFIFKMMKHFGGRDPFTFSRIPSAGRFIFMNIILYSFYRGVQ